MNTYSLTELQTRDDRRDHIAKLMLSGEWTGAGSRRALAEAWGVRLAEVYQLEGEAAGGIRQARKPGWAEEVEAELAHLDAARAAAWLHVPEDHRAISHVIKVGQVKLQVYGALGQPMKAQQKPEGDDLDRMPVAEQRALLQQALAELDSKEARH